MRKTRIKISCLHCGKTREVVPSVLKRGSGKFCSGKCARIHQWSTTEYQKMMSEAHKGNMSTNIGDLIARTRAQTTKGYRTMRIAGGNKKQAHRVIIQRHLVRELKSKEHVHHWNEKKDDNRLENLAVMRHLAAHRRIHAFADRHGLPVESLKFGQPWLFSESK